MARIKGLLSGLAVPALAIYIYTQYFQSSVLNDQTIYSNVDWWDSDTSPFLGLLRSNAVRVPFFTKHFPRVSRNQSLSVLDIGCGGGYLSEALAQYNYNVTGVDMSASSIAIARQHAKSLHLKIKYMVGSATELPFEDNAFDVIVASDVLGHIPELTIALDEIFRVLKPKGIFLFDCLNRNWWTFSFVYFVMQELLGIIPKGAHDWRLFVTPEEMRMMLFTRGFLTDASVWKGRHWNTSWTGLVVNGTKSFIKGMFVDNDLSDFYMGLAIKEE
jgi:2-polyprenyl-6-hydroxyphenyl methylase/3-demethylubiquinone-9 3-methyltransferase